MANVKLKLDVRDMIMLKMTTEGRTLTWLAEAADIPYDTIYGCLKKKLYMLSDRNLAKINKALETDFKK